jgi:hypothetical protein
MTIEQLIQANPEATDVQILAKWVMLPPVTRRAIPLKDLGEYLREVGLMAALKAVAADPEVDAAIRAAIQDFLDQLADIRAVNLDTTNVRIAVRSAAVLTGLRPIAEAIGLDADEVTAAIYALGGGLAHGPISEADVAAMRAVLVRRAAVDALAAAVEAWHAERERRYGAAMNGLLAPAYDVAQPLPTIEQVMAILEA